MKARSLAVNVILVSLLILLFCGLQTTLWYSFVGSMGAPQIWLNVMLFLYLYRKSHESIWLSYFLSFFILPFTALSLGILWMVFLAIWVIIQYVKDRFFWPGIRYFILASLFVTILFHVFLYLFSQWWDFSPTNLSLGDRLLEVLLTPFMAPLVYGLMGLIDHWTVVDPLAETRGSE